MNKYRLLVPAVAAVLIGGCSMAPKYVRPDAPVPATMPSGPAYKQTPAVPGEIAASDLPWQEFLADPRLQKVMATALVNNRDLRIAVANVERVHALYGIQEAELLPTVNATASGSKQGLPADLSGTGKRATVRQYGAGLAGSWELDFFGKIRSLTDAALEDFLASQEARRSAQISLVSSVANAYLALAADRENLAIAQTTLQSQQDAYDLVRRRYERGLSPELDLYRAQTQVDTARRGVARFTQIVAQDQNALNLLVGSPVPDDLLPEDLAHVLPPRDIPAGVSSAVLLQRPDILEAEHRLKAANANIGAARAAFFPTISLTGSAGTASSELSGLFKSGSGAWSYGPQISMPIFDPRVWSAAKLTKADQKIALAQYEKAIQSGFKEVADVLAVRGTVDQEVAAQESLVQANSDTYRISSIRYVKGVDSYLAVLDAQRSLYASQQALVEVRLQRLANQVRLYAALGGGWQTPEDTAATTKPSR